MTKQVVIWGAWYGSHNVGDQALLLAITDILAQNVTENVQYKVLTNNASWIKEYTSRESQCQIAAIQSRQEIMAVIKAIKNCDLFIIGGGVPFFDQPSHVLVMLFLIGMVRCFRKPYLLWSVSSQAVRTKFATTAFRWVLAGTRAITYRDKATETLFASCGVSSEDMFQAADPGFALAWEDNVSAPEILRDAGWDPNGRPLVALTPRTLRPPDGESESHYRLHSPGEYRSEIASFAAAHDWLWENGYQPVFIPMNTVAPDDDLIAAGEIITAARYGKYALVVKKALRPRSVPGIYRQCQAGFVARVHGSIMAMLAMVAMGFAIFCPARRGALP